MTTVMITVIVTLFSVVIVIVVYIYRLKYHMGSNNNSVDDPIVEMKYLRY